MSNRAHPGRGNMPFMALATIPIHTTDRNDAAGCGACMHTAAGPVCLVQVGDDCRAPTLEGPPGLVQQVMAALTQALTADGQDAQRLVRSLRLVDGEAELVLAIAGHCAGALVSDTAFQTLRRLLPDTDIYVSLAA